MQEPNLFLQILPLFLIQLLFYVPYVSVVTGRLAPRLRWPSTALALIPVFGMLVSAFWFIRRTAFALDCLMRIEQRLGSTGGPPGA